MSQEGQDNSLQDPHKDFEGGSGLPLTSDGHKMLKGGDDSPNPQVRTPRIRPPNAADPTAPSAHGRFREHVSNESGLVGIYQALSVNIFRFVFNNVDSLSSSSTNPPSSSA